MTHMPSNADLALHAGLRAAPTQSPCRCSTDRARAATLKHGSASQAGRGADARCPSGQTERLARVVEADASGSGAGRAVDRGARNRSTRPCPSASTLQRKPVRAGQLLAAVGDAQVRRCCRRSHPGTGTRPPPQADALPWAHEKPIGQLPLVLGTPVQSWRRRCTGSAAARRARCTRPCRCRRR